jgi:hypothetical protein
MPEALADLAGIHLGNLRSVVPGRVRRNAAVIPCKTRVVGFMSVGLRT